MEKDGGGRLINKYIKQSSLYKFLKKIKLVDTVLWCMERHNDVIRMLLRQWSALQYKLFSKRLFTDDILQRARRKKEYRRIECCILFLYLRKKLFKPICTRSTPLVVSLTSHPTRFPRLHIALYSLLEQQEIPDEIVLWLIKEECAQTKLPFYVRLLCKHAITLEWRDTNYKSYNKLLYPLKEYPNANIVICDDDVLYPDWWLQVLYREHLQTPQHIIGHRGYVLHKKSDTEVDTHSELYQQMLDILFLKDKEKKKQIVQSFLAPSHNVFLEGVGGILFPRNSLVDEIFNVAAFSKLCPTADDIWFKVMAIISDTQCRMTAEGFDFVQHFIEGTQEVGLYLINMHGNQNDIQIKKTFDAYNIYKHL